MWQMHIREVGCHTAGRCWDITTMGMLYKPEQSKIHCLENWADVEIINWVSEKWCWGETQFLNNMQSGEVSVKQVLEFQVELFTFVPKGRSVKFLPCEGIGLRGITCTTAVSFAFRNGTAICCLRCSHLTFESALAIQYLFSEPKL